MKRTTVLCAAIALLASSAFSGEGNIHRSARRIPGRYIVVLDPAADASSVAGTVRNLSGRVHQAFSRGVKGLAVEVSDTDAQTLARDPRVQFVEEDATISAAATPWGLDRIDQHFLPLNGSYVGSESGNGVTVYVVDTGIAAQHVDFNGRVAAGFDAISGGDGRTDCNGHGTHVAGVIGGASYGVAKSATLVPVRALDCNGTGTLSSLLAAIDWILQDHAQSPRPSVVNMSLGGDASSALDSAVISLLANGLTTVVAAGNGNVDACTTSPARVPGAITVGASTESDQRASFSNYGGCIDLFAPGTNILSDWNSGPTATALSSGTSAAAPFVTGVAALVLQKFPDATAASVNQTILTQATSDVLASVGTGSPNRLVFSLIGALADGGSNSQLLSDPGFDYGMTFWTSDICTVVQPTGCPPSDGGPFDGQSVPARSGNSHASIGGGAKDFHLVSEPVTLPATVSRAELSLYLWIITKDNKHSADDVLTVEIRDRAGALLETIGTFSNRDACQTYLLRRFDVTRYRGATIRVSFTGVMDQGPPTWFQLDDVALNIWR